MAGCQIATFNGGAQQVWWGWQKIITTVSAPKMDEVVCARNFLKRKGAKPILQQGATSQTQIPRIQSTTLNLARSKRGTTKSLPEKVGRHSKRVDTALLGKHTRKLYDDLTWKEANLLAQLRTGMARLNTYLYRIKAAQTEQCDCDQAKETVEHFLFRCTKWTAYRTDAPMHRHT